MVKNAEVYQEIFVPLQSKSQTNTLFFIKSEEQESAEEGKEN